MIQHGVHTGVNCKHSTQKVISKEWYGNSTLMKAWLVTFHFKVRDQYILFPDCSLSYFMIPCRYISNKTLSQVFKLFGSRSTVNLHLGFWYRRLREWLQKKYKNLNCSMKNTVTYICLCLNSTCTMKNRVYISIQHQDFDWLFQ